VRDLIVITLSVLVGALIAAIAVWRGYSVRPTKLSLPFLQADLERFSDLSAVEMFDQVSMAAIPMDRILELERKRAAAEATPVMLIHTGWHIVCEAFIRRFEVYPDDTRIIDAASVIGGQNVEFVRMYRDILSAAISHPKTVSKEFAANYLIRAPSLAERIEGHRVAIPESALDRLTLAASIVQG
jgi:hypothetical protein